MTLHVRNFVSFSCRRFLPFAMLCTTSPMLVAQTLKHHAEENATPAAAADRAA